MKIKIKYSNLIHYQLFDMVMGFNTLENNYHNSLVTFFDIKTISLVPNLIQTISNED